MTGLSQYLNQNPILSLMLICHFLSDFHLQSQKVADLKHTRKKYLLKHLFWVAIPLFISFFLQWRMWWILLLIWFSHAAIDLTKPLLMQGLKLNKKKGFLLDQFLHLTILLATSFFYKDLSLPNLLPIQMLPLILFLILISKPTTILFRLFFQQYQPDNMDKIDTIPGAGARIGLLERIIMGICILFGQFASIGLVFTAKSIARYNKISENPAFAEYYLIGSLFSILSALVAAWICLL